MLPPGAWPVGEKLGGTPNTGSSPETIEHNAMEHDDCYRSR